MKQISIDNGHTFTTDLEEVLERFSLEELLPYMDDATVETVHNMVAPCGDIVFLLRYLEIAPDDLIIG